MENFNLDIKSNSDEISHDSEPSDALRMNVSPICEKDGQKVAYVTFSDDRRSCEGEIPACIISKNDGFSPKEIHQLESYMKVELPRLKKMASGVNVMRAFMGQPDTKTDR